MQSDAVARRRLAARSHELREAVTSGRSELRQKRGVVRRQRVLLLAGAKRSSEAAEGCAAEREALAAETEVLRVHNVRAC
jgi:hypothetical protein